MALDESLFDRRTLDRYRKLGLVTDEQIREYLRKLPDVADKAEPLDSERSPEREPPPRPQGKGR